MAIAKHTTPRPFDGVAELADAYEALANMANSDGYAGTPLLVLLDALNHQLRAIVDDADKRGLVS